jgi:hypothetical protein
MITRRYTMKMLIPRGAAAAVLTIVLAGGAVEVRGQELPDAKDIVARYQEAVGGAAVLQGRTSMHARGQFSMPALGISGALESFAARPNRSAMRIEVPGFGEIRAGYTGAVGWSMNPAEGPRLMQGGEAQQMADESQFDSSLRLPELITSVTTVEHTKLGGRDCIKVKVIWKSGRETFDCYSGETGLLVGTMSTQQSAMGTVEAVTLYDEYREFDGVRMATRVTVQAAGMEQILTIDEVSFNSVPDSALEPPAQIKALIDR